jgi:iron complex transport system substrate-binding protein
VCGPSGNEVTKVLKALKPAPTILWQTPKSFGEVLDAYVELGEHTGKQKEAEAWVQSSLKELESTKAQVRAHLQGRPPVRVAFFEWIEPIYAAGHWVPQMLEWAGGADRNAREGKDSVRIPWEDVVAGQPEVVRTCGALRLLWWFGWFWRVAVRCFMSIHSHTTPTPHPNPNPNR